MTRRRWTWLLAAALAAVLGLPLASLAYWTAPSTPGGRGGSVAGSVAAGNTPGTSLSGRSVALGWTATSLSNGAAVAGYVVTRYDTTSSTAQVTGPGCAGLLTALGCTETGLPDGSWAYTVSARYATNWRGAESSASPPVVISVPGAPTAVAATPGDGTAAVSWTAPTAGSSPVTSYAVTASPGGATCSSAMTACTVYGLTDGTAYTFTVVATSAIGDGPASSASTAVTPLAAPGAPTAVSAPAGDQASSVSWTAPDSTGGGAVTGYTVTATPTGGTTPTATCTSTASPCTVQPLIDGLTYAVTVTATNAYGTGPASTAATTSPYPTALLTSSNLALWVDGADPAGVYSDTGCTTAATSGAVACWKDRSGHALNVTQATAGSRMTLTTLNGRPALTSSTTTAYYDSGSATSTYRTVFAAANPTRSNSGLATILAAPASTDYSMRLNNGQLRNPGTSDGNDWQNGGSQWTDGALNGLTPASGTAVFAAEAPSSRTNQTVSISTAFSASGTQRGFNGTMGEVLAFSRVLTTPERRQVEEYLARKWAAPLAPSAPTTASGTAAGSDGTTGSVLAGWTAPAWDGGPAITAYTATASPGGASCTGTTSCTITGLSLATSYTLSVTATNSAGTGPATLSAPVAVAAVVPGTPTAVHAAGYHGGAGVTWTPPATDGGSDITAYVVTASPGGATCSTSGIACDLAGLTDGTTYSVTVTATNAVGSGSATAPLDVTPTAVSGPPEGVSSTPGDTTASISWTAPSHPGLSSVTSYRATAVPADSSLPRASCSATASPCSVGGLTNGELYTVFVVATDGSGDSSPGIPPTTTPYPSSLLSAGNLGAWVDAAQPGTVFSDTGCSTAATSSRGTVACVKDRAGGTLTYGQSTAANQPGLTTLNGLRALSSTATTWLTSSTSRSFRTVVSVGTGARSGGAIGTTFAAPANSDFSQRVINAVLPGSPGASSTNGNDWHSGGSAWTSGVLNGAPPPSGAVVYASEASGTKTGSSSISTSFLSRGFVGPLGEVLAFNRVLTADERRQVEEYLGRKWGAVLSPAAPVSAAVTTQGGGAATVTWSAPAWNGGASITSYAVTTSTGTGTCTWTSGLTASCTGLSTASQTFSVTATNAIGKGPAAVTSAVTPTVVGAPVAAAGSTASEGPLSARSWSSCSSAGVGAGTASMIGEQGGPGGGGPATGPPPSGSGEPVQPTQDDALAQRPGADVDRRQAERAKCTLRHQGPRQQLPGPAG